MNLGYIIIGIGGAALVGVAATQDNPFAQSSPEVASIDGAKRNFTVSDNKHYFQYELSSQREVLRGIVTMTDKQRGISEGGALVTLHYFDDKAAKKFTEKYAGTKQCPAPFFNRNAKHKILMASDPQVAAKLKAWKNRAYKDVSGWQDFKIIGQCLTKTVKAEINGETVYPPSNFYDNCLTFHVDSVEYSPRTVSG